MDYIIAKKELLKEIEVVDYRIKNSNSKKNINDLNKYKARLYKKLNKIRKQGMRDIAKV